MSEDLLVDVQAQREQVGDAVDTFGGAAGENKARGFDVFGYAFLARSP